MDTLNVGVIGLGWAGNWHLENYKEIKNVKAYAVCDPEESRSKLAAVKYSVPHTFTDYHELLDMEEVDVVSVCVPNFLHAPVTIEALEKGKHVLIEKPMAMNSREAEDMAKKAKAKKKTLAVAMNYRYAPERQFLKRVIESGDLGRIYYVKAVCLRRKTFERELAKGNDPKKWFIMRQKSSGGALIDMGPHLLDLAMWCLDDFEPTAVYGVAYRELMSYSDVDDLASAMVRLKGGATINLEVSWESFVQPEFYHLFLGTKGGAKTNPPVIYRDKGGVTVEIRPQIENGGAVSERNRSVYSHFIDCVRKGTVPEVSAEKGVVVMKVLDAIYESAKKRRLIELI